jgi:hypothetical protein
MATYARLTPSFALAIMTDAVEPWSLQETVVMRQLGEARLRQRGEGPCSHNDAEGGVGQPVGRLSCRWVWTAWRQRPSQ